MYSRSRAGIGHGAEPVFERPLGGQAVGREPAQGRRLTGEARRLELDEDEQDGGKDNRTAHAREVIRPRRATQAARRICKRCVIVSPPDGFPYPHRCCPRDRRRGRRGRHCPVASPVRTGTARWRRGRARHALAVTAARHTRWLSPRAVRRSQRRRLPGLREPAVRCLRWVLLRISGYDGWGCEVSTTLRVPVHQYDCFNLQAPVCAGGATEFHGECIGREAATIDGRPYDTLEHQLARNGHGAARIVMKIDVEGAEWDVFATAPDDVLERIDQLVVEFHKTDERRFLTVVQRLARYFHVANLHMNNHACSAGTSRSAHGPTRCCSSTSACPCRPGRRERPCSPHSMSRTTARAPIARRPRPRAEARPSLYCLSTKASRRSNIARRAAICLASAGSASACASRAVSTASSKRDADA